MYEEQPLEADARRYAEDRVAAYIAQLGSGCIDGEEALPG